MPLRDRAEQMDQQITRMAEVIDAPRIRERWADALAAPAWWSRARGWALALGVAFVASSADDPVLAAEGRAVIDAVLADPDLQ